MNESKELKKAGTAYVDGVNVAEYCINIPRGVCNGKGDKRADRLFESVFDSCSGYAEKICERAKKEYENDENEKKRFFFRPYRYTSELRVTQNDDEFFSFLIESTLSRRGRILSKESRAAVIRKRDGLILPVRAFYKKGTKRALKALKKRYKSVELHKKSFYLSGGKIMICGNENGKSRAYELPQKRKE